MIATSTATNALLAVLAFNVLIALFLYVLQVREDRAIKRRAEDELYLPSDWEWPAEDTSSVRHGGLGR